MEDRESQISDTTSVLTCKCAELHSTDRLINRTEKLNNIERLI